MTPEVPQTIVELAARLGVTADARQIVGVRVSDRGLGELLGMTALDIQAPAGIGIQITTEPWLRGREFALDMDDGSMQIVVNGHRYVMQAPDRLIRCWPAAAPELVEDRWPG